MVRNQHGFIILDEAIEIENNLVNKGRKPKTWLLFENEEYLFKTNSSNYEIWSELLASELGKQFYQEKILWNLFKVFYMTTIGVK